jgi:hypothetical protein
MNEMEPLAEIGSRVQLPAVDACKAKSPTKAQLKLVEAGERIKEDQNPTLGFLSRFLVQCNLPHTDPGNVPFWKRRNNEVTLVIQPGIDPEKECSTGYPYGVLPRLILIWIITTALLEQTRRLVLGKSFAQFLKALGLDPYSHGPRSDARRVQQQLNRLLNCTITTHATPKGVRVEDGELRAMSGKRLMHNNVSSDSLLWWDAKSPDSKALFESYIELSLDFYATITERKPVPLRLEAIRALRRSPLALDLYVLCAYLVDSIERDPEHKPHSLQWTYLMEQMGCKYTHVRNFRTKINTAMRKVKVAYPELRFRPIKGGGGLQVLRSRRAIQLREPQRRAG